jgi:hypothetical protein
MPLSGEAVMAFVMNMDQLSGKVRMSSGLSLYLLLKIVISSGFSLCEDSASKPLVRNPNRCRYLNGLVAAVMAFTISIGQLSGLVRAASFSPLLRF